MKAQVSIEYLLLLAISFSAIAILLYSMQELNKSSSYAVKRAIFIRESSFLYSLMKEVCITGDGNRREVEFPYGLDVEKGEKVRINSSYGEMEFELGCDVEKSYIQGKTIIENVEGRIVFR